MKSKIILIYSGFIGIKRLCTLEPITKVNQDCDENQAAKEKDEAILLSPVFNKIECSVLRQILAFPGSLKLSSVYSP
jgi:hypothetical protein